MAVVAPERHNGVMSNEIDASPPLVGVRLDELQNSVAAAGAALLGKGRRAALPPKIENGVAPLTYYAYYDGRGVGSMRHTIVKVLDDMSTIAPLGEENVRAGYRQKRVRLLIDRWRRIERRPHEPDRSKPLDGGHIHDFLAVVGHACRVGQGVVLDDAAALLTAWVRDLPDRRSTLRAQVTELLVTVQGLQQAVRLHAPAPAPSSPVVRSAKAARRNGIDPLVSR